MTASSQTLRVYDQAIMDWLGQMRVNYGTIAGRSLVDVPVLRVMSDHNALAAELRITMASQGLLPTAAAPDAVAEKLAGTVANQRYRLPLMPVVRIKRLNFRIDRSRAGNPITTRTSFSKGRYWDIRDFPQPLQITYEIEMYSMLKWSQVYLAQWLLDQFSNIGATPEGHMISPVFPAPWGVQPCEITLRDCEELTDVDSQEIAINERVVRTRAEIVVHGRSYDLIENLVPMILTVNGDLRASSATDDMGFYTGELYGQFTGPQTVFDVAPLSRNQFCHPETTAPAVSVYNNGSSSLPVFDLTQNDKYVVLPDVPAPEGSVLQLDMTISSLNPANGLTGVSIVELVQVDADGAYSVLWTKTASGLKFVVQAFVPTDTAYTYGFRVRRISSPASDSRIRIDRYRASFLRPEFLASYEDEPLPLTAVTVATPATAKDVRACVVTELAAGMTLQLGAATLAVTAGNYAQVKSPVGGNLSLSLTGTAVSGSRIVRAAVVLPLAYSG